MHLPAKAKNPLLPSASRHHPKMLYQLTQTIYKQTDENPTKKNRQQRDPCGGSISYSRNFSLSIL
jgi:hypothetical protein